jgi:transketolase
MKELNTVDLDKIICMARKMRKNILEISHNCNLSTHLGGALSIVDITATLYGAVLKYDNNNPEFEDRDRFILSKGHGALGYYSALLEAGIISDDIFSTFQQNGSDLTAHPVMNLELGIESSNGSLGQGLSMGIGLALAAKRKNKKHKIFVLLGNGECNEGSIWEAVMSAVQFKLDNLVAIIDNNRFQNDGDSDEILDCVDFEDKWKSFGWNVSSVNGHNILDLYGSFTAKIKNKPTVVIAHTIKGKGVSFMEDNNDWHHNRLTKIQYEDALLEMIQV